MRDLEPITTGRYLGGLLFAYLVATGLFFVVHSVSLVWSSADFFAWIKDVPFLNVIGGMLGLVMIPVAAVLYSLFTAVGLILHAVPMLLYMGLRQRGPRVRTPIVDVLASGALMYGMAFLVLSAHRGLDPVGWFGLIASTVVGGVVGLYAFRLSQRRQATLRGYVTVGPAASSPEAAEADQPAP
jgi:hypothetical protein